MAEIIDFDELSIEECALQFHRHQKTRDAFQRKVDDENRQLAIIDAAMLKKEQALAKKEQAEAKKKAKQEKKSKESQNQDETPKQTSEADTPKQE